MSFLTLCSSAGRKKAWSALISVGSDPGDTRAALVSLAGVMLAAASATAKPR